MFICQYIRSQILIIYVGKKEMKDPQIDCFPWKTLLKKLIFYQKKADICLFKNNYKNPMNV